MPCMLPLNTIRRYAITHTGPGMQVYCHAASASSAEKGQSVFQLYYI